MRDTLDLVKKYISARKWLLVTLPIFFVLLFVTTLSFPHEGNLLTPDYTYSGTILNDEPNGKGMITYENGDSYSGNFKQGKFDKKGTFYSKSGKWHYTGTFSNGVANGQGIMTMSDGKTHAVIYKNGVLVK